MLILCPKGHVIFVSYRSCIFLCPTGRGGYGGVSAVHAGPVFSGVPDDMHDGSLHSLLHRAHVPEPTPPAELATHQ